MEIPRNVRVQANVRSHLRYEEVGKMATQLCQKCKQAHPGGACDYNEKAECAETTGGNEVAEPCNEPSKSEED